MNTRIDFTCKFCGKPRVIECDIPTDCPALEIDKWKALLVCNRCADYERARRDSEYKIAQQAASLIAVRYGITSVDKLSQMEQKCRENLTILMRHFCKLVCDRRGKSLTWDPEMVEYIMAKPDMPYQVLNQYKRTLGAPI